LRPSAGIAVGRRGARRRPRSRQR